MKTVIFYTESATFKFDQKEVRNHLIENHNDYAPNEVAQLLKLVSTDNDETILVTSDIPYFGYVNLDLIGSEIGIATCKLCGKNYDAGQLKESAIGQGKSPFDIKRKQKGGFRLTGKRKNPSTLGGKAYKCTVGHILISIETWKT